MPASNARIPYVQRVKSSDGKVRLYFRKGGYREGPLVSPEGSDDLRKEVAAIAKRFAARSKATAAVEGTVGGMLLRYAGDGGRCRPCAEFLGLAAGTQTEYLRMATEIREDCGEVLLSDISVAWLRDLRDAWAPLGYKAANDRRQVLKNALKPALEDDRLPVDPFTKIGKLARPHDVGEPHPIWEDHEFDAAVADALARDLPGLARAYALARGEDFVGERSARFPSALAPPGSASGRSSSVASSGSRRSAKFSAISARIPASPLSSIRPPIARPPSPIMQTIALGRRASWRKRSSDRLDAWRKRESFARVSAFMA